MIYKELFRKISILITYSRRGHTAWLSFLMSMANFMVIQYMLLIERIPSLKALFPNFELFFVFMILIYVPLTAVIGWWDTKHATLKTEQEVNPYFYLPTAKEKEIYVPLHMTILRTLEKIAEKEGLTEEREKIIKMLQKMNEYLKM